MTKIALTPKLERILGLLKAQQRTLSHGLTRESQGIHDCPKTLAILLLARRQNTRYREASLGQQPLKRHLISLLGKIPRYCLQPSSTTRRGRSFR